jgi:hypothetical protein
LISSYHSRDYGVSFQISCSIITQLDYVRVIAQLFVPSRSLFDGLL